MEDYLSVFFQKAGEYLSYIWEKKIKLIFDVFENIFILSFIEIYMKFEIVYETFLTYIEVRLDLSKAE